MKYQKLFSSLHNGAQTAGPQGISVMYHPTSLLAHEYQSCVDVRPFKFPQMNCKTLYTAPTRLLFWEANHVEMQALCDTELWVCMQMRAVMKCGIVDRLTVPLFLCRSNEMQEIIV